MLQIYGGRHIHLGEQFPMELYETYKSPRWNRTQAPYPPLIAWVYQSRTCLDSSNPASGKN